MKSLTPARNLISMNLRQLSAWLVRRLERELAQSKEQENGALEGLKDSEFLAKLIGVSRAAFREIPINTVARIFGDELFPLVGKRHRNSLLRVRSYTAVAPIFISNSISCCQRYFLAAVKILTQAWISSIIALKTPISAEWLGISSALEIVPLAASAATAGTSGSEGH